MATKKMGVTFWKDLKDGQKKELVEKLFVAGKDIWIKESFTPVVNQDNEIYKFISVGLDITDQIQENKIKK
jgi:hypothetical protein